jgi:hypothetical protein
MDMMSKISIVENIGSKLPEYVDILQDQSQYGMKDPQEEMVFSTVHKFQCVEMDTVRLLDDFIYMGIL